LVVEFGGGKRPSLQASSQHHNRVGLGHGLINDPTIRSGVKQQPAAEKGCDEQQGDRRDSNGAAFEE
jgi:hypothetical protein